MLSFVNTNTWELSGQHKILAIWDGKGWELVHIYRLTQHIIVLSSEPEIKNLSYTANVVIDPLWPFIAIGYLTKLDELLFYLRLFSSIYQNLIVRSLEAVTK